MRRTIAFLQLAAATLTVAACAANRGGESPATAEATVTPLTEPPIRWVPPPTFDPNLPGKGFPQLPGVENTVIYDPEPSRGNVDEGGDGKYESVLHGTYNHHPNWVFRDPYVIAWWTNHSRDENAPGQRVIGRIGKWVGDKTSPGARIDWGRPEETTVEIAPPPIPIRRRHPWVDPDTLYPYVGGGLSFKDDRIYLTGHLTCIGGYTTKEANRRPTGPLPVAEYRDRRDEGAGYSAVGFRYDLWYNLGMEFVQPWKIENGRLVPDGPLYQITSQVTRVEVTPGRWKTIAPLQAPYTDMTPIAQASEQVRRDFPPVHPDAQPARPVRSPYPGGDGSLAADGKNGLAHGTEYARLDGKLVSVRDNLLNPGHYYASIREPDGLYPPAIETNLYGGVSPKSGRLPDGRFWLLCNEPENYADRQLSRRDMYLVLSRDGIVFDRTWLLVHIERRSDGGMLKHGGPQYFNSVIIGPNLWVFYSITKEQMGVTKIPLANL